jgi:hypothetical protein
MATTTLGRRRFVPSKDSTTEDTEDTEEEFSLFENIQTSVSSFPPW